ncbi:MAG TPA: hypothetical protein VNJ51_02905 [Candidatus Dormibacteraeota bacterium]|nr:hypothetical protein [Candidatus Dormibacteraeota bacterium]
MIDLWNPQAQTLEGAGAVLLTATILGMVHGVTPDEHTWPITFSYAVGSYSTKGGMRAGLLFSLAFTVQRAIASELAYFALARILEQERWEYFIYTVVGLVMAASGFYVLSRGSIPHLFHVHPIGADAARPPESEAMPRLWGYMPLVHGFIAGWGTGAFALIVYATLAPAMHSPWLAFLPGLFFGLGTMVMQVLLGGALGAWMARRRLPESAMKRLAQIVSGQTLAYGGIAFAVAGAVGLFDPALFAWSFDTGIRVHNLAHLGVGFLLVVVVVFVIAGHAFYRGLRAVEGMQPRHPGL